MQLEAFVAPVFDAAVAVLIVLPFFLLILAAIGWWLEDHAPVRDEDEELSRPYFH
jgi:hypothetical protein